MGIVYCYKTGGGLVVERVFQAGQAPDEITLPNGRVATRDRQSEARGMTLGVRSTPAKPGGWPMKPCVASGVHASQAPELREHFKKHGLSVEVTNDGDPIYESPGQRKQALRCRGMCDRNSN